VTHPCHQGVWVTHPQPQSCLGSEVAPSSIAAPCPAQKATPALCPRQCCCGGGSAHPCYRSAPLLLLRLRPGQQETFPQAVWEGV
jgi:hypothetical protein